MYLKSRTKKDEITFKGEYTARYTKLDTRLIVKLSVFEVYEIILLFIIIV